MNLWITCIISNTVLFRTTISQEIGHIHVVILKTKIINTNNMQRLKSYIDFIRALFHINITKFMKEKLQTRAIWIGCVPFMKHSKLAAAQSVGKKSLYDDRRPNGVREEIDMIYIESMLRTVGKLHVISATNLLEFSVEPVILSYLNGIQLFRHRSGEIYCVLSDIPDRIVILFQQGQ